MKNLKWPYLIISTIFYIVFLLFIVEIKRTYWFTFEGHSFILPGSPLFPPSDIQYEYIVKYNYHYYKMISPWLVLMFYYIGIVMSFIETKNEKINIIVRCFFLILLIVEIILVSSFIGEEYVGSEDFGEYSHIAKVILYYLIGCLVLFFTCCWESFFKDTLYEIKPSTFSLGVFTLCFISVLYSFDSIVIIDAAKKTLKIFSFPLLICSFFDMILKKKSIIINTIMLLLLISFVIVFACTDPFYSLLTVNRGVVDYDKIYNGEYLCYLVFVPIFYYFIMEIKLLMNKIKNKSNI